MAACSEQVAVARALGGLFCGETDGAPLYGALARPSSGEMPAGDQPARGMANRRLRAAHSASSD
jgi:hypothetical protein